MWPFIPRKVMESIPISSAPTFRPDEALPEAPDAVSAVKKQEADYILRVFYILWSAFLDFRETTWTTPIAGVPNHDTLEPVIIVDELKTDRWNGYWSKFPTDRIPPLQDTTTRVQVLCTGSCLDTAHFTRLIEQVFEGIHDPRPFNSDLINPRHVRHPRRNLLPPRPLPPDHIPPHRPNPHPTLYPSPLVPARNFHPDPPPMGHPPVGPAIRQTRAGHRLAGLCALVHRAGF
ncbi:hypothetical protein SNOG_03829 [Parastagonospora nodorum SN15]|uniref:Uncharacterized protein n=1 Tax=Phaeosphaeria nodorum (strain SN15 / ATCC MYA-4574 / FGSC 10173) TaxID=321614 RepID=Q0UWN5_PHANO|nr:hypothetical protein SNOG_03829 [Parastagonospora nodorum SN15]EAT89034.2 hypothetical protein SNOG_03829 [Parastagonospora nodorum SN15]